MENIVKIMLALGKHAIKSILVTGSNRGIGLELVKYLVEQNEKTSDSKLQIISCCRQSSPELEAIKDKVHIVQLEVTDTGSVDNAVKRASEIVGDNGLNVLINNAAIMKHGKGVLGCSENEFIETLSVNVIGAHSVTNRFYPLLKQSALINDKIPVSCARAAVVNISSELGSISNTRNSFTTAYRVSKAALNMLTKCASTEFIKDNVLCISVHPGWVRTDLGGQRAPLSTRESVEDIVNILNQCAEQHNGQYVRKGLVLEPY